MYVYIWCLEIRGQYYYGVKFREKLDQKVFYHFAIFAIIDKILIIIKYRRILILNNFFTQVLSTLQKNSKR